MNLTLYTILKGQTGGLEMRKTMSKSLQRQFEIVHFIADCKEGTHFSDLVKRFKVSRATIVSNGELGAVLTTS